MTEWQHRDLARGRWHDLSLAEQFGNIGSEISRAINWSARNPDTARSALYRALELIDLTLDDPRHRARRHGCGKSRASGRSWSIFSRARTSTDRRALLC